jgi:hypothetical protein
VSGGEEDLRLLRNKLLGVVLEVGLHLGKEPSKLGFIASVLIGYSELSFTRLVDHLLKLSILLLKYSDLSAKLLDK